MTFDQKAHQGIDFSPPLPKRIGKMKPPSLKEIAEKAGVSTATVSDVLNGKAKQKRISPVTEDKILKIAKKLDYRPNLVAKSLVHQRSNTIGLMFQDLSFSAAEHITTAVFSEIEQRGYGAFITVSQWNAMRERSQLNTFIDRRLDGAIAVPLTDNAEFYGALKDRLPVVQILDWLDGVRLPAVCLDGGQAIRDLVTHLYQLGHRNIGFLGVQSDSMQLKWRYETFLQLSAEFGLSLDRNLVIFGRNSDEKSVHEAGINMLAKKNPPTAIIAVSDPVAVQLMEGLLDTRFYGTVAIAGVGDSPGCGSRFVGLTSVSEPLSEIGRIAAEMLIKVIDGKEVSSSPVFIKGVLKERHSTLGVPLSPTVTPTNKNKI